MTVTTSVPASITTPDTLQTRLGTLEFTDGAPTPDTAERLYENLDFAPPGSGAESPSAWIAGRWAWTRAPSTPACVGCASRPPSAARAVRPP